MSKNKKDKRKKSEQGSEMEGKWRRKRKLERERKRKGKMVSEETQAVCVSRRLAICVVFYDNYKYDRKALCLEQLVRLSKLCPYSPLLPHAGTI